MDTKNIIVEFRADMKVDLDLTLAIIGSGPELGDWDVGKPVYAHLPFSESTEWTVKIPSTGDPVLLELGYLKQSWSVDLAGIHTNTKVGPIGGGARCYSSRFQ